MSVERPASFDPRVTPARADLAAAHLQGRIAAPRYVAGQLAHVSAAVAPLRFSPDPAARLESELLFGETFTVYDRQDRWLWGQNQADGYVGYVPAAALANGAGGTATHRIAAARAHLYREPEVKRPAALSLSFASLLRVVDEHGPWRRIADGRWLHHAVIEPLSARADPIASAERLIGTPYLWGGRSAFGLDCSALLQLALRREGTACPRDCDQIAAAVGSPVPPDQAGRGDLVFWPGHCGFHLGDNRFLHANAFDMRVAIHPFDEVVRRSERLDGHAIGAVHRI